MKKNQDSFPAEIVFPTGPALVFAPHPDDEVFGCGGAIIRHLQHGDEVNVIIVTDGSFPLNESQKTADYPEIRKQESLAAAKILGYGKPQFLDFRDGFLEADEKLIARLLNIIREFQPKIIYLPSETEIHPDHLALNKAGTEAAKRFPENIDLFFYEIGQPLSYNFLLDITVLQPILDQAMDCFTSQLAVQDYKNHIRSLHAYRSYTLSKNVNFAEAYRTMKSDELKTGDKLWQEKSESEFKQPSGPISGEEFPLISVIVRTMNRSELAEALQSIAGQTYPNLEVIVVDARGETPLNPGNRCGRFPLRVISKNKALIRPTAANAGLDAVKGKYFCFLDEDDLMFSGHIETLFMHLNNTPYPAAYDIIERVNENNEFEFIYNKDFDKTSLLIGNFIPLNAIIFKSEILDKGVCFDHQFSVFEDWDFMLQVALLGDFLFVNHPGGIYRNYNISGVHSDPDKSYQYKKQVFRKWLPALSDTQLKLFIDSIYHPENQPEFSSFAQLFIQTNTEAFSEATALTQIINGSETELRFRLLHQEKVTGLRFDPLNGFVIVTIKNIQLMKQGKPVVTNFKLTSNATHVDGQIYHFDKNDPQLCIDFEEKAGIEIDEVILQTDYHKTGNEALAYFLGYKEGFMLRNETDLTKQKDTTGNFSDPESLEVSKPQIEKLAGDYQNIKVKMQESISLKDKKIQELESNLNIKITELETLMEQNKSLLLTKINLDNELRDKQTANEALQNRLYKSENQLKDLQNSLLIKISKTTTNIFKALFSNIVARKVNHTWKVLRDSGIIKKSGLFDESYYLQNNPDVKLSGMPALKHYLLFGGFEGRNPSNVFDSAYYLDENPDVKQNGYHPLLHYILYGSSEGRKPSPDFYPGEQHPGSGSRFFPFWPFLQKNNKMQVIPVSKPHFSPPVNDFSLEVPFNYPLELIKPAPDIAVICHLFYIDLLDEIKNHLANIPYNFDLYITTDTEEKRNFITGAFTGWKHGKVRVKTFENRGRDIAPKLLAWPQVYEAYEYFLHIHTKKTLQEEVLYNWRKYLYDNLLGSEEIVKSIFEAFACDPKLGIVAPQHFQNVRHAIGWGHNFEIAEKIAEKIAIPISKTDPVDFPSGSMFWARTASIKPLLELNFTLADFPEESGQIDNTLAHVIERLYFFGCEKAGYFWIKIIHPTEEINTGRCISVEGKEELQQVIRQIQFPLLADSALQNFNSGSEYCIASRDFLSVINTDPQKMAENGLRLKNEPVERKYYRKLWEYSDYTFLTLDDFVRELKLHHAGKTSKIDFDETFYLQANTDVARLLSNGSFESGFVHFCLSGRNENRRWSNRHLTKKFDLQPNYPAGMFAPVKIGPLQKIEPLYKTLSKSKEPFLLILFGHLQSDLFYAGYNAFFDDFVPVFDQFSKIVLSVESDTIEPGLATQYTDKIEVINQKQLKNIQFMPDLIVGFSNHEVNKALAMFNSPDRLVYYCQEYEAGFYPFGTDFIKAERAITIPRNIILSTGLLKNFLQKKKLLKNSNVFVTSPEIDVLPIKTEKTKKLFFYFRPEYFHTRNIPEILWETVHRFCETHSGYEMYMVGSIETRFSFEINHNPVFVLSKLPKTDYFDLIASCDVVVAMIYSAHPGVIAFQAAASGIPTVTNIFDNRDAATLKQISENIVPFDPVNEQLLDKIELALSMPKGKKSFDQELYSGKKEALTLSEFIFKIWNH